MRGRLRFVQGWPGRGRGLVHRGVAAAVLFAVVGSGAVVAAGRATQNAPAEQAAPVSHSRVLTYLRRISGSGTVAGQHNREPLSDPTRWTDRVHAITGVTPVTGARTCRGI